MNWLINIFNFNSKLHLPLSNLILQSLPLFLIIFNFNIFLSFLLVDFVNLFLLNSLYIRLSSLLHNIYFGNALIYRVICFPLVLFIPFFPCIGNELFNFGAMLLIIICQNLQMFLAVKVGQIYTFKFHASLDVFGCRKYSIIEASVLHIYFLSALGLLDLFHLWIYKLMIALLYVFFNHWLHNSKLSLYV